MAAHKKMTIIFVYVRQGPNICSKQTCPVECEDTEILCTGSKDYRGCKIEDTCVPKGTDNSGEYVLEGSGVCLASEDRSGWRGLGGCCLFMASEGISLCLGEVLKNKF